MVVISWSDGANVGALLAAQYPKRITQLAMWGGNSQLYTLPEGKHNIRRKYADEFNRRVLAFPEAK